MIRGTLVLCGWWLCGCAEMAPADSLNLTGTVPPDMAKAMDNLNSLIGADERALAVAEDQEYGVNRLMAYGAYCSRRWPRLPYPFQDYVNLLRHYNPSATDKQLEKYPGTAQLVKHYMRPGDGMILLEDDKEKATQVRVWARNNQFDRWEFETRRRTDLSALCAACVESAFGLVGRR